MKPDEKYMNEAHLSNNKFNFKFTPPSFNRNLSMSDFSEENNTNNNDYLDLYPSETEKSELYCYYSSFGDCNEKNSKNNASSRMPSTFDVLRGLDLDLNETEDLERKNESTDVDKIYSEIESRNPGILDTFDSYNIPKPISLVFIKRLIKLSLLYSKESR